MTKAQAMRSPIGPVGVPQLNYVASPPEYGPQATSTPAGVRTTINF